jgi:predicted CopG family antitoxin
MSEDYTTIAISRDSHKQLSQYKVREGETFEDALRRLFRIDGVDE